MPLAWKASMITTSPSVSQYKTTSISAMSSISDLGNSIQSPTAARAALSLTLSLYVSHITAIPTGNLVRLALYHPTRFHRKDPWHVSRQAEHLRRLPLSADPAIIQPKTMSSKHLRSLWNSSLLLNRLRFEVHYKPFQPPLSHSLRTYSRKLRYWQARLRLIDRIPTER